LSVGFWDHWVPGANAADRGAGNDHIGDALRTRARTARKSLPRMGLSAVDVLGQGRRSPGGLLAG